MSFPFFRPPSWLVVLLFAALILSSQLVSGAHNPLLRYTGIVVLFLAGVFMFIPFVQLKRYGQPAPGGSYMDTRVVAESGLYAIVRHPQYMGYILLFAGFALLAQHWATWLLAAAGIAVLYAHTVAEEQDCLVKFGQPYREYMLRVPRYNFLLGLWRRSLQRR